MIGKGRRVSEHCRHRAARTVRAGVASGVLLLSPGAALAQRTGDNAVTEAEDAFGTSIGRETIGLYGTTNVRGFSPIEAGNVRIDGLYFDQVWGLSPRLRRTATIRVGLSAQSYPFPSPTGIVDYELRKPANDAALTLFVSADEWGASLTEIDGVLPIADRASLALGGTIWETEYYNGTDASYRNAAATLRWRPSAALEIVPYWQRSKGRDDEAGPIYVPVDGVPPARVERRRFDGPEWVDYAGFAQNHGTLLRFEPAANWLLRVGLFRSMFDDETVFANLLVDLQPDGSARRLIIADPPPRIASTSGEIRLSRSVVKESTLHLVHLAARARERERVYGGSALIDLGPTRLGATADATRPDFTFAEQTHDRVRQRTFGVAYEARRRGVGELGIGLQHTDYEKRVAQPDAPVARTASDPWIYYVTLAATPTERLAIYAGYTRGLEESGVAPDSATNRNEALPAIRTRQADAGVRYAFTEDLKVVAGVFDVRKPYLSLDADGRFGELGTEVHRGIEGSLSGALGPRVDIVAGVILQRPRVRGEPVAMGHVGSLPIGQAERTIQLNIEWRPPALAAFSFDATLTDIGEIAATTDNRVELPGRTLLDIGGRYRFALGRAPAVLRVSITNLFDEYGYELRGSGAYDLIRGRLFSAYLTVDW
jgi:iron complex outermembrane recepter protein